MCVNGPKPVFSPYLNTLPPTIGLERGVWALAVTLRGNPIAYCTLLSQRGGATEYLVLLPAWPPDLVSFANMHFPTIIESHL
jgi:hypothetical protein